MQVCLACAVICMSFEKFDTAAINHVLIFLLQSLYVLTLKGQSLKFFMNMMPGTPETVCKYSMFTPA